MLELYRDKLVQERVPESITTLVEKMQYLRRTLTDEFEKWVLDEYKVVSKRIRGTPSVAEMRDAIRHRETASNEMYQELFDHVEALAS
ncbi:uncharacterized protein KRP23_14099 [Phytophthora ramorum]|nr:hypothetical protein KRP23_14099 [Phytophthora ramorum]